MKLMSNKYLIFKLVGPHTMRKTGLRAQRISNSQISEKAKLNYSLWITSWPLMTSLLLLWTVPCTWEILSKPTWFWKTRIKNNKYFFFFFNMCRLLYYLYSRDCKDQPVLSDWCFYNVMELLSTTVIKHKELDNEVLMLSKVYPWK